VINDYYLVVAEVRKRLAVSKQTAHRFQMERFSLKKLNKIEGKDINKACKSIRENYELKKQQKSHGLTKDAHNY
jgi:hypothetical protein